MKDVIGRLIGSDSIQTLEEVLEYRLGKNDVKRDEKDMVSLDTPKAPILRSYEAAKSKVICRGNGQESAQPAKQSHLFR